jgi:hypothetical protein
VTYQELDFVDDLSYTVPTKINENFRKRSFLNQAAKSADFTVWADDSAGSPKDMYGVTTGASTIVATLPSVASGDAADGRTVTVMKMDAGAGTVRITPDGSETINGTASFVALSSQYDYRTLVYDGGSGWVVIASS